MIIVGLAGLWLAAPAAAQDFTGPWVEGRLAWDNIGFAGVSRSGLAYAGGLGYDFRLGSKFVIGPQLGIGGSTAKICAGSDCVRTGRDIEALARVGVKVEEALLVYALGGYVNGRLIANVGSFSVGENVDGYRLGLGAEIAYNRHFFGKVDYRYSSYDTNAISGVNRHQVGVSLGYRF